MEVVFERVAGLDVGKASVVVCVRTPGKTRGRHQETRTFKTTTGSLRLMRDWLLEEGVTIAAIESTSTYWKSPFYCLEEVMEVWLLNAAHMKAVPGRKSDVRDAEWIARRPCPQPDLYVSTCMGVSQLQCVSLSVGSPNRRGMVGGWPRHRNPPSI